MSNNNLQILKELNNFMLTSKNICNIEVINNHNNNTTKEKIYSSTKHNITEPPLKDIFFPTQKDQLFWCFYIILYDTVEYDMITNFFTKEYEIKYKLIDEMRDNKEIFKPIKISKNSVETELMYSKKISMNSIKALCYLKQINVFYIDNSKYYEIIVNENNPIYVIEKINNNYGIKKNITCDKIDYYRNNFWKLENLDKPLKAISSYKADELRDICKKIKIEFVKLTKPQMYEKILYKLNN